MSAPTGATVLGGVMKWRQPPVIHRASPGRCYTSRYQPCTARIHRVTCTDCLADQFHADYSGQPMDGPLRQFAASALHALADILEAPRGFWRTLLAWDHYMVTCAYYAVPPPSVVPEPDLWLPVAAPVTKEDLRRAFRSTGSGESNMSIDLQTLATVRVKFLESREHLLCVIPSPNQVAVMQRLATATYEFNRALGLSAVRREAGTAADYYSDAVINIEQVTSSDFRHEIEIGDGREAMLETAHDIHAAIMALPLPRH